MDTYKKFFLGQSGHKILSGLPDDFGSYFDWVITPRNIYKNNEIPKSIYLKTDFLNIFASSILSEIKSEFILITACSDFSPEINYRNAYKNLINDPRLKFWYMNNMYTKNEKSFSLPAGLGSGVPGFGPVEGWDEKKIDETLLNVRLYQNTKKNKIFCSFRSRDTNVCGNELSILPKILKIVKENPDLFDYYEPDKMDFISFIEILSQYKYSICPYGNGLDPSPTMWLSLIFNTIPVIYRNPNVEDMFAGTDSVIYFNKFEDIISRDLYIEKEPIDLNFLTCEYWAHKIKSKIL